MRFSILFVMTSLGCRMCSGALNNSIDLSPAVLGTLNISAKFLKNLTMLTGSKWGFRVLIASSGYISRLIISLSEVKCCRISSQRAKFCDFLVMERGTNQSVGDWGLTFTLVFGNGLILFLIMKVYSVHNPSFLPDRTYVSPALDFGGIA